jgi:hypothetical protein
VAAVLGFINGGELPHMLNNMVIILIPKIRNPQSITQFCLISLCTILYNICSKTIANCMRPVMEEVISVE